MVWATQGVWLLAGVGLMALTSAWWRRSQPAQDGPDATSWYWDVVYVDDNGEMLLSTLHVLGVDTQTRRLTAWCSVSGCERQFRISRIARAQDLQTGRRVNIARWMGSAAVKAGSRRPLRRRLWAQPAF